MALHTQMQHQTQIQTQKTQIQTQQNMNTNTENTDTNISKHKYKHRKHKNISNKTSKRPFEGTCPVLSLSTTSFESELGKLPLRSYLGPTCYEVQRI